MPVDLEKLVDVIVPVLGHAYGVNELPPGWTLSKTIYLDKNIAVDLFELLGMIENDLPFGVIAQNGDDVIVAFRGTQHRMEWAADLDFDLIPYETIHGAQIATGFGKVYGAVRDTCQSAKGSLTIVGHSLGSALALLFAVELQHRGLIPRIVLLGCPRVGNAAFCNYIDSTIPYCYRIVNRADIVPHLPPELLGFRHPGVEVLIDGKHDMLRPIETSHHLTSYIDGLNTALKETIAAKGEQ